MAFVAIVVAWTTRARSGPAIVAASRAARKPVRKPRAGSSGVVGVLRLHRRPLVSSASVTSVKVPPTSRAIAYSLMPLSYTGNRPTGPRDHGPPREGGGRLTDASGCARWRTAPGNPPAPRGASPARVALLRRAGAC